MDKQWFTIEIDEKGGVDLAFSYISEEEAIKSATQSLKESLEISRIFVCKAEMILTHSVGIQKL